MLEGPPCNVLRRIQIAGDRHRYAEHDSLETTHERDCALSVTRAEPCQQYRIRQTVGVDVHRRALPSHHPVAVAGGAAAPGGRSLIDVCLVMSSSSL
jgi:hypothetical protein